MTGFGKANLQLNNKKVTVEIKSLNSKGFDLNTRIPAIYREKELPLRNQIALKLERGKIDFAIYIENNIVENNHKMNVSTVLNYMNQLKTLASNTSETELLQMALTMPEVFKTDRDELDETEWQQIEATIQDAIAHIVDFRQSEGKSLEKEFRLRIENIRNFMNEILALDAERIQAVKERLQTAIEELKVAVDANRYEQELIYYLEKLDITEEKVRLTNHLDYFLETIEASEANGRKLGFITQEMGREINTMGSKANHAKMQKLVVMMKDELEKIKEQVLNVL
jgi:uncharacterized protein (TIGR00255 family)